LVLLQCLLLALYLSNGRKSECDISKQFRTIDRSKKLNVDDLLDSIVRSETNPVRDGLVLLLSDRKGSLGSERLLGRLSKNRRARKRNRVSQKVSTDRTGTVTCCTLTIVTKSNYKEERLMLEF
jgi:hypothetical protein